MTAPTTTLDLESSPRFAVAPSAVGAPAVVQVSEAAGGGFADEVRGRIAAWNGDPEAVPGASIVKSTRRRVVARFPAHGPLPAIFVKQENVLGFWNRARVLLTESHAEREFRNAEELMRRGVKGPRPVAYAAWKSGGLTVRTLSVTEELAGGTRLDDFIARFASEKRRDLIAEVAAAIEGIHRQDIDLTDCHRANLMIVSKGDDEKPEIALLDLATVRFHVLGVARRIQRLGQLLHSLRPVLSYEERRLFVERYARAMGVGHGVLEDLVREVRASEERVHQRRERSRDRRCVVDSTEYYVRSSLTARVFARRSVPPDAARRLTGSALTLEGFEREGARIVKREGRNECALVSEGGAEYFVKRVHASSIGGAVVDAIRGSRGRRAWRAAHALGRRGIPAPKAFALVETGWGIPMRSALLTEALAGATTVLDVATRFDAAFDSRADRVRFLTTLGEVVGRLHNADVDHDDLAIKNILVVNPANPRFYFIDLEAVEGWYKSLSKERVLRALMQLDDAPRSVSRADRMRFLVAYEKATQTHLTRDDIAEIRRMLRERFAKSGRNYFATGPR